MLNLREYQPRTERLSDHLPWAALVAPGVILNKDGSFQRTFRFRGPDLESVTDAGLIAVCARANNALRRFGSGWALFFEADRVEALSYPTSIFPDAASALVDAERRSAFESVGHHFESRFFLTLVWLPDVDHVDSVGRALLDDSRKSRQRDWRAALHSFTVETNRALDMFAQFMPEVSALDDAETLTFLHDLISEHRHPIVVPETPMYLDSVLADTPLSGGLEPKLGVRHLRTLTVRGFPNMSRPAMLDALNHQAFPYRWTSRFLALDRTEATRALTKLRRQWFNKRKSVAALLREVMYNQSAHLLDTDADNKVADSDAALEALGEEHVAFGYLTMTITVSDADPVIVEERVRRVEQIVNGLGFTIVRERLNAVEAWLSSLPGQVYANVRQPLVHTLNMAHLMPLSAIWAGPASNAHLDGPPLLSAQTGGTTPFRLSTHIGDVGHMLIVGPTGAGKSVLLALLALQFRRYPAARVCMFDKGLSARAAILAMGGTHHMLGTMAERSSGRAEPLAFQPLREIDRDDERRWAADWIAALFAHEKVLVTPDVKEMLWASLNNLASAPADERTLTGLSLLLPTNALKSALLPYTLDGAFGGLLDATEERLRLTDVQCFETEALMAQSSVIAPVLTYLFHRLEAAFDGRPTMLVLDEAWIFLDNPLFAGRIREWLKVLRKKNVAVIFATQSLSDISQSAIAPAIIESCPQRIFLPNDRASEPQSQEAYQRFGLNERQIELIARATPKRQYYLQSARGNRLFDVELGPIALAFCASAQVDTQRRIDSILAERGVEDFARHFLLASGLAWAAQAMVGQSSSSIGDMQ
jgi:type IV secretion/conjugal transfer VirB4 family ATPase